MMGSTVWILSLHLFDCVVSLDACSQDCLAGTSTTDISLCKQCHIYGTHALRCDHL